VTGSKNTRELALSALEGERITGGVTVEMLRQRAQVSDRVAHRILGDLFKKDQAARTKRWCARSGRNVWHYYDPKTGDGTEQPKQHRTRAARRAGS